MRVTAKRKDHDEGEGKKYLSFIVYINKNYDERLLLRGGKMEAVTLIPFSIIQTYQDC